MVTRARSQFRDFENALKDIGISDYEFEARLSLEFIKGEGAYLKLLTDRLELSENDLKKLYNIAKRRESGEPLQYIFGEWEFYGYDFYVGDGVLIPRQDTETLVELVLEKIKTLESPKLVDLCSGTGCIPITLSLKRKDIFATAIELYPEAFSYLEKNIERHLSGVDALKGDALSEELAKRFSDIDIITSNPPYLTKSDMQSLQKEVKSEPETALFGGDDGLEFYREIPKLWYDSLKEGGMIFFEIGFTQGEDVKKILNDLGYKNAEIHNDLAGKPRVVSAMK